MLNCQDILVITTKIKLNERLSSNTIVFILRSPWSMFPLVSKTFFKFFLGVYSQEKVQRTVDAMKQRRDNLIWVKCRKLRL